MSGWPRWQRDAMRVPASWVLRHAGGMDVELLIVPDCPHERSAYDLTRVALDELDLAASVIVTVIETDEQAQARGFTGSPTFLINGRDPFAQPGAAVGVACRVYQTYQTSPGLAGVPSLAGLREAMQRLAAV
jgi:hypothetical protein